MGTTRKRAPTWAVTVKIPPRVRPGPQLWHLPALLTRCSGVSYFPMQATIIILLSIENQVNWILKSHMSTCQSHSSLTHTSNPQNKKLMTIIFFWNLIWFSDTLLGHTKIYCMNISGVYTQFSAHHSNAVSQLIKSINFSLTLTSTGWLQPSKLTVFFHLPKWVKSDPDPN